MGGYRDNPAGIRSRLDTGIGVSMVIADARADTALGQPYIGVRPQPFVVGLGYWIVPDARRQGLATRAVQLGSTWALQTLGAARVEAWAAVSNEPSQRVLSAAGFTWEGVLRAFLGDAGGGASIRSRRWRRRR